MEDAPHTLRLGIDIVVAHVSQLEVAIEVENDLLRGKGLTTIGHLRVACHFRRSHVLIPYTVVKLQHQVLLLCRRLHHSRVCQNDGLIVIAARLSVDHDTV